MKLEQIFKNVAINFADGEVRHLEILSDAFDRIRTYEDAEVIEDDFEVQYPNAEPTNDFSGIFITSILGTYLLHDMRMLGATVLLYSITKLTDQ
jgi:hypothetical protein